MPGDSELRRVTTFPAYPRTPTGAVIPLAVACQQLPRSGSDLLMADDRGFGVTQR